LEARLCLEQEIASLLQKQAIEEVVQPSLAFWSRIFLVPKPGGQWRVILNLKPLNSFIQTRTFKMETIQRIAPPPTEGVVGHVNRPERCLLSRSYSSRLQTLVPL
jgi:hypothetical protein